MKKISNEKLLDVLVMLADLYDQNQGLDDNFQLSNKSKTVEKPKQYRQVEVNAPISSFDSMISRGYVYFVFQDGQSECLGNAFNFSIELRTPRQF